MSILWEVLSGAPLVLQLIWGGLVLYLLGCIIYAFIPDKKTAESEFKEKWIKLIDQRLNSIHRKPSSERNDKYLSAFSKLHCELREEYGGDLVDYTKLSSERRYVIEYLLSRQRHIMG